MEAIYNPPRINPELTQPLLYGTEEEYGIEYPVGYEEPKPGEKDTVLEGMKEREEERRTKLREEMKAKKTSPAMQEISDRERFRASAVKQLPGGKDPFLRDIHKETRILFDQRIDGLRQHVFKGIPRNVKLTPDQEAHFTKQAQQLYQMCQAETQDNLNGAKEALSNMMARFDMAQEETKAKQIQATKETPEEREAREKRLIEFKEKVKKPTGKAGAAAIQVYDRFKEENPDYKGDIKEFQKALKAKDPLEMVLGLAGKDFRVQVGTMDLGEVAKQYLDAISKLQGKEGGKAEAKMPDAAKHKGKTIRDTSTGKRYKSNGKKWIEIK